MEKITFCIPSKSNLRYLKTCIPSIRKNAFKPDHDIIIFVDSDEDGTIKWLNEVKDEYNLSYYVNPDLGNSLFGIGKAYDYCIKKSTTDIFMIFHADMMLGKNADQLAFDHLDKDIVVSATRVEPPIHPNNGEKILMDFGMWPEEFKKDEFDDFVDISYSNTNVTDGVFAPWMMYKEEFLAIGGHDEMMHSCREDSDIFNRLKLAGFTFIQPWNSLVYHLTGRGAGSFEGDEERHRLWQMDMMKSTKEFIRKWGSNVNHTPLMNPVVSPKYNIGFIINNASLASLSALETWCTTVYIHDTDGLIKQYISIEQPNTKFSLIDKVLNYDNEKNNDILVEFDANTFNQEDFIIIQQLAEIIKDSGDIGTFQIGNLKIIINKLTEYQNNLIKI
jgi:glycosyltransferase involved in cell wall biosynthesis